MRTVLLLKRKSTHLCEPIYVRPHTRVRECVCTRVYMCVYTCVSTPYRLVTRRSRSLLHVTRRPQRHCRARCCWASACGAPRGMSVSVCSPAAAQDAALWVSESPCPQAPKPRCCGLFAPAPSAFMLPADPRPGRRQRRCGSPLGLASQVPESPAVAKTHVGHDSEGAGGQIPN